MSEATSPRTSLLREAESLVMGDRNNQYGPPSQDFQRTADALNALGYRTAQGKLQAHDVAMILMVVKMSRITWTPKKRDSWVDLAGYAACGYECTTEVESEHGDTTEARNYYRHEGPARCWSLACNADGNEVEHYYDHSEQAWKVRRLAQ